MLIHWKPIEIELIRRWIEQGGDYDVHWSYRRIVNAELPKVTNPALATKRNRLLCFAASRISVARTCGGSVTRATCAAPVPRLDWPASAAREGC